MEDKHAIQINPLPICTRPALLVKVSSVIGGPIDAVAALTFICLDILLRTRIWKKKGSRHGRQKYGPLGECDH